MKRFVLGVCATGFIAAAVHAAGPAGPPFDLEAIRTDPLEAQTVQTEVTDGMVVEHVTFNGDRDREGKFIRLSGILARPEGGQNLPGLLWCQGGMADASTVFPLLFARKGYVCLCISLAKQTWDAVGKFNAADPKDANLVRFAVEQMRGVTYIASRAEVDANRLGVAGASYGGVFSTFVAGADPRIKAGMSFFGAGNHRLGTNLPQFTKLEDLEQIDIFGRTGDGAAYLRGREIPFIWGLPTNDNWFYLPAVVETYRQKPGEKRIAILPHWVHGFPPELDQQLFDWFDIYLKGTRKPYLSPGRLKLEVRAGRLAAEWPWTGEGEAKRAVLVASYGRILPWHGWRHRYYHEIPAEIKGCTARAEIPVPEPDLPMLVFGNVWDEREVLTSTDPVEATPRALGIDAPTGRPVTAGCPRGALEPEDTRILQGTAQGFGRPDNTTAHSGRQSVALDPPDRSKKPRRGSEVQMMLFNVYERDHRLSGWLKSEKPMMVDIRVRGQFPANWDTPAVKAILATMPAAAAVPAKDALPTFTVTAELGPEWKEFTVDCPFTGVAVEGYTLTVDRRPGETSVYWIDDVRFETQWRTGK